MAYFECIVGSANGQNIPLKVICASDFSGLAITCTDGTTRIVKTCPSSSPYEINYRLPNTGTWTISGTISGTTYSESILITDYEADLSDRAEIEVDVYSAANDTVSYIGLDGQTHTIITDSAGHGTATIEVVASGGGITFTSSVAKQPNDLSSDFSKAIRLDKNTTSVYVMPNDNTLYWYGYNGGIENMLPANGWANSAHTDYTWNTPTWSTNYITCTGGSKKSFGVGSINPVRITDKICVILQGVTAQSDSYATFKTSTLKDYTPYVLAESLTSSNGGTNITFLEDSLTDYEPPKEIGDYYFWAAHVNNRSFKVYAMWYE